MLLVGQRFGAPLCMAFLAILVTAGSALAVEWQSNKKPLKKTISTISTSVVEKMDFLDSGYGVEVACTVTDTGTAEIGTGGTLTLSTSACEKIKTGGGRCESAESVLILNSPWKTTLVEEGDGPEDVINTVGGAGEPRFEISCHNAEGALFDDTCNMGGARATTANGTLSGTNIEGVLATFVKSSHECGVGAEGNPHAGGEMEGPDFLYTEDCPNMEVH